MDSLPAFSRDTEWAAYVRTRVAAAHARMAWLNKTPPFEDVELELEGEINQIRAMLVLAKERARA